MNVLLLVDTVDTTTDGQSNLLPVVEEQYDCLVYTRKELCSRDDTITSDILASDMVLVEGVLPDGDLPEAGQSLLEDCAYIRTKTHAPILLISTQVVGESSDNDMTVRNESSHSSNGAIAPQLVEFITQAYAVGVDELILFPMSPKLLLAKLNAWKRWSIPRARPVH